MTIRSAVDVAATVRRVHDALAAHPKWFDITLWETGSPATEAAVAAVEARLDLRVPAALRELYLTAGSMRLEWRMHEATCIDAGYREELTQAEATLTLVAVDQLREVEPRVVSFTSDCFGCSWCLDLRWGIEPTPIIWYDRGIWEGDDAEPNHDSFDEMWPDFAACGFVSRPNSQAELVWDVLHTGQVPPPGK